MLCLSINCKSPVFLFSTIVFSQLGTIPCIEDYPLHVTNLYKRTKLINKNIMHDIHHLDLEWKIVLLKYFNPIRCDLNNKIGEDLIEYPNNFIAFIQKIAIGCREMFTIFGTTMKLVMGLRFEIIFIL